MTKTERRFVSLFFRAYERAWKAQNKERVRFYASALHEAHNALSHYANSSVGRILDKFEEKLAFWARIIPFQPDPA